MLQNGVSYCHIFLFDLGRFHSEMELEIDIGFFQHFCTVIFLAAKIGRIEGDL
jgi:hypothetical protein